MKTQLQKVLEKKIDRRDFLKYVGSAMLAVIGVGNLLRLLTHRDEGVHRTAHRTVGYGAGSYGGRKQS